MTILDRLLGKRSDAEAIRPYRAVVERAREPHWYIDGAVPDTIDGRFDMIAAVLAMLLLRLERSDDGAELSAALAERFIDDMDGQLRQIGLGDIVVGKHVGRMMGMLGGRLGAYRDGIVAGDAAYDVALIRNLYRGQAPQAAQVAHVREALNAFRERLADCAVASLAAGELP